MRKIISIFCLVLTILFVFSSCYNTKSPENNSSGVYEETSSEEIEMGQILSQGNYYVVFRGKYSDEWMHYYRIIDENGEEIRTVQTWMDEAKITEMQGGILKISIQTGFDETSVKTTYFDIKTTRSSPDRYRVLTEKNDYVAYVLENQLVISEMFSDREVKRIDLGSLSEDSEITAEFDGSATSIDIVIDGKKQEYKI